FANSSGQRAVSEFGPPARDFKKGPYPEAGCALWTKAGVFVGPCGAGNIEVRPGDFLRYELFEKHCPDDRPGAAIPNVFHVGHVALQSLEVRVPQRQRPESFPN